MKNMQTNKKRLQDGDKRSPQMRAFSLVRAQEDQPIVGEDRLLEMSFSSDEPCDMGYLIESLSHDKKAANLDRMNGGAPLLFNHDRSDVLGVVEKAWIDGKQGRCTVRFGKDARGQWAMDQVNDRVLSLASFMYRAHEMELSKSSESGPDEYTTTSWTAYEASLVTVPADPTVGVGRASDNQELPIRVIGRAATTATAATLEGNRNMDQVVKEASGVQAETKPDPAVVEAQRRESIVNICKTTNLPDAMREMLVTTGASVEQARGFALNEVLARGNKTATLGGQSSPDLTEKEKARYSMLRAIRGALASREGAAEPWKEAGFEREVSNEIARMNGKETGGIFMPTNLPFAARAADYSFGTGAGLSATSGGSNIVATNLLAGSFIDLLRNKAKVFQLGARLLSGLVGNVDIPRQKASGSVYWVGEGATLTQTGGQFDKVSLTPKHIGALTVITRNMLLQATPDIEMLARADLLATVALGIDLAALSGSGSAPVPRGIVNQSGINSVVGGANGAQVTIDNLIDMETKVAQANADADSMAYLVNAVTMGSLKKLKDTTGRYLWTQYPGVFGNRTATPGEINGYPVARSNQARSNLTKGSGTSLSEIIFGDWSQLLVGEWGVVEIMPNPYAAGVYESGGVELRILQTLDLAVRHPESFSVMSDAITA